VGAGAVAPNVVPNAGAPKVAGAGAPKPPVDGAAPKPTVPNVDGAGAPKGDAAGGDANGLVFCCPNMLVLTLLDMNDYEMRRTLLTKVSTTRDNLVSKRDNYVQERNAKGQEYGQRGCKKRTVGEIQNGKSQ
jgi:hypothetical protein